MSEAGPLWLTSAVVAFGVAVPVAVTALRVSRAVRGPVRDALSRVEPNQATPLAEGLGTFASPLPLVARMAVRSCVRRPRRVLLTGLSLALGLAFFMTALNVRTSLLGTVESVAYARNHDLAVTFSKPWPTADLRTWIAQQPGVRRAEFWTQAEGVLRRQGLQVANPTAVLAAPAQTWAMRPHLIAGRWLDPDQPDGIVVTQKVLSDEPAVRLGGAYQLAIGGRSRPVRVIGVVKEFGAGAVYVPRALFDGLVEADQRSNLMFVDAGAPDFFRQLGLATSLEAAAAGQGLGVAMVLPSRMMDVIVASHLDCADGAASHHRGGRPGHRRRRVASSISVSVVERYREIGVLKAVGGRSAAIVGLFASEAVVIALVGWAMALIPAPLFGRSVAETFGSVFIEYPFDYRPPGMRPPSALALAVLLALLASLPPHRRPPCHGADRAAHRIELNKEIPMTKPILYGAVILALFASAPFETARAQTPVGHAQRLQRPDSPSTRHWVKSPPTPEGAPCWNAARPGWSAVPISCWCAAAAFASSPPIRTPRA